MNLTEVFSPCIALVQHGDTRRWHLRYSGDEETCLRIGFAVPLAGWDTRCIDRLLEMVSAAGYSLETTPVCMFQLRRVHLNSGGYTAKGRYYGTGMPLYEYSDEETGEMSGEIRAYDREDAKAIIRRKHPYAIFHR